MCIRDRIIDYARQKSSAKRGNNAFITSLSGEDVALPEYWESMEQIIEISNLMDKLRSENPRWIRVVDARYFCGFTEEETATVLGLSSRTVRRDWLAARAWIAQSMGLDLGK